MDQESQRFSFTLVRDLKLYISKTFSDDAEISGFVATL